ncbi:MAG: hypothetical protein KF858_12675 [Candidatus Sumerlaeia bacterium]|nr:hypothetical protein [Candidatus Sumerlaeia bacterium]
MGRDESNAGTRRPGAWLVAGLLAVALLAFSGRLETSDELLMAATSHALAWRGSLEFPEIFGQTSTGYGLGTPLVGVPLAWIEGALHRAGRELPFSLLPLANALLFVAMGLFAAGMTRRLAPERPRLEAAVFVALVASPLLPASATFASEPLAAAALLGLAWALVDSHGRPAKAWALAAPAVLAAAGICARPALLPLVGLVLVWGWLEGARRPLLVSGAVGIVLGVLIRLGQNAALRGSPFAQGYEGQEFVTPLLTGAHGLLLSPERGLLVFWPVLAVALVARPPERTTAAGRWSLLVLAALVFSVVFHGTFWTWHGGWTAGPRFLLPVVALGVPAVAAVVAGWREGSPATRTATGLALAWGAWAAGLYTVLSPIEWWNELWGFHQVESRWQFEPQLALWQGWAALAQDEAWKPVVLRGLVAVSRATLGSGNALLHILVYVGALTGLVVALSAWSRRGFALGPRATGALVVLGVVALGGAMRGPRGWTVEETETGTTRRVANLRLAEGPAVRASALLDLRPHGTYALNGKAAEGTFEALLDGQAVWGRQRADRRVLLGERFDVKLSGLKVMEVEFAPDASPTAQLRLYWSWPGEGRVLAPLGGEYVLPRELTAWERGATLVWRGRLVILAAALALLLLLPVRRRA